MRSRLLIDLEKRYKELRRSYLPSHFSRTGNYSRQQYTDAIAFRILFHAELENFLENLALSALSAIEEKIQNNRFCRGCASLIMINDGSLGSAPSQIGEIKDKDFVQRLAAHCGSDLRRRIGRNNGVKVHNLMAIFIPLGVNEVEIADDFLIDLNTIGSRRGDVAHKGIGSVTVLPDPREEKVLAERIILSLAMFERMVNLALA